MPIAPGFEAKWQNVPDYVLGITHEIWERRRISSLEQYYASDLIVRSPASIVVGNRGIVAATQATLAEFPDRELPGEDVIWCWSDSSRSAFLSSHRLLCRATHSGPGLYGAPTGRKLTYRILADCYCAQNQVRDEWLIRDQGAIVRQMGSSPEAWVRALIQREGGPDACVPPFTPERDVAGPYNGRGTDNEIGASLVAYVSAGLSGAAGALQNLVDRAAELHYPGMQTAHGRAASAAFWLALRSALPDARPAIHHVVGRDDPSMPPRAAVRWSLTGLHDGAVLFGPASGVRIHVMGITHAEFGPRGLRREWTLFDETAIWKQILLATGRV
ncbi:MAG: ester cyclase [Pseudomonadota bacterium]